MTEEEEENLIQRLHDEGRSIIDAIKAVRAAYGIDLGAAKRLVEAHPAWGQVVEAAAPLHEELIQVMAQEDND